MCDAGAPADLFASRHARDIALQESARRCRRTIQ
jgi:hypothetical protein